jgi:hypothetical protein
MFMKKKIIPKMALSTEALVGILTLIVTCPPSFLLLWNYLKRRSQATGMHIYGCNPLNMISNVFQPVAEKEKLSTSPISGYTIITMSFS